jgi:glycosyltransferase involved in cell wall biosynthesis
MSSKVSVIIPAFNAARFLTEAIASVRAQAVPTEIIVVDDGSQDETAAVARTCADPVRCISITHRGASAARNTGLEASSCDLVAFLDADDVWAPGKLESQCAVLERRPEIDMVFGHLVEFADGEGYSIRDKPAPGITASAMLARRSVFERFGRFVEQLEIGEFIDWYSRAKLQGASWVMLDQVVFHRRVHDANTTRRAQNRESQYISVIRDHLARKRRLDDQSSG